MSDTVWAAVIGGVAGLGTGVLGSLLGPWSQWGVDKRRDRRASRKLAVERWRAGLAAWDEEVGAQPGITDHRPPLHTRKWFSSLSRHLHRDIIEAAMDWDTVRPDTLYAHPPESAKSRSSLGRSIQDAIDGLAKKWDVYEVGRDPIERGNADFVVQASLSALQLIWRNCPDSHNPKESLLAGARAFQTLRGPRDGNTALLLVVRTARKVQVLSHVTQRDLMEGLQCGARLWRPPETGAHRSRPGSPSPHEGGPFTALRALAC